MQILLEGRAAPIPVEAGDTILDSLLRAGVLFSFSCQTGDCGACKCELLGGNVQELACSDEALTPEERANNIVLACRSRVRDDTVVRFIT